MGRGNVPYKVKFLLTPSLIFSWDYFKKIPSYRTNFGICKKKFCHITRGGGGGGGGGQTNSRNSALFTVDMIPKQECKHYDMYCKVLTVVPD